MIPKQKLLQLINEVKSEKFKKPKMSLFAKDSKAKKEYKKSENKEATGAASAGGYSAPLFGEKEEGEFKEATTTASVGAYDAPGFEDVNMRGNNPIGRGRAFNKPQIPGGGFVSISKKCKTFPYCSQGDSKDKPVRVKKKPTPIYEAIYNVSKKTGLSISEIKNIILQSVDGNF
jgi:hypothetical protein